MSKKASILDLLEKGTPYSEIMRIVSCSKSTISHYAQKFGLSQKSLVKYDWAKIDEQIKLGRSFTELQIEFGFSNSAYHKAALNDKVSRRQDVSRNLSLNNYAVSLTGKPLKSTRALKKRLSELGRGISCEHPSCLRSTWNGSPIPLQLDHIDGNRKNNLIENLRFLCPNCHAQASTWGFKKRL